jgi:transmembrane sensor
MVGLAALAAAACLAFVFGGNLMLRIEADHMTATAEQRRVQLADGTVVLLAPESAIDVVYGAGTRRVRLLKGRAYFDVAADRRPFVVQAGEVEARDIGTAFDIGLDVRGVDVAVREGIVDVGAPGFGVCSAFSAAGSSMTRTRIPSRPPRLAIADEIIR